MQLLESTHAPETVPRGQPRGVVLPAEVGTILQKGFGQPFAVVDGATGEVLEPAAQQPACDWSARSELCREVARRGRPELLHDEDPFLVLAIPVACGEGAPLVAVGTFVTRQVAPAEDLGPAAAALGLRPAEALDWAMHQTVWPANALRRMSDLVVAQLEAAARIRKLQAETEGLSQNINATYEEISLLHRLTQDLKLSRSDADLGRIALEWMEDVLPARGLAIQLVPAAERSATIGGDGQSEPLLLVHGDCPLDNARFTRLIEHLAPRRGASGQPLVVNRGVTQLADWPCPEVRELIAVPLADGENLYGWMAAVNHISGGEFGTGEASLLNSVAVILGIHSGNVSLYRQQADLMAGIIRALTAAIDAKDQYTCGHSDRVARLAVRLARQLHCDPPTINTIYLAGLLHDIGKIGISDSVLRKPGKLSDEEYEHIKTHPAIGHTILRDIKKLDNLLPVILHHHEAWNGAGYPRQLHADEIPLAARIVAVADSYDAMGSDRPYRQGMPDERIDEIFRRESGVQWDPQVVAAFFAARDDLRRIVRDERSEPDLSPHSILGTQLKAK